MTVSVKPQIVTWARWGVEHHAQFNYEETRPMPLTAKLPLTTDCSGFVTLCYFLAGAPDPNGCGYDGAGYTGTLLDHGQRITLAQVQPGDVIVYGPDTGWHTALIVEAGPDPLTVSMGEQGDPSYVRVSQDGREPQTYLRFATNSRFPQPVPEPKPLPAANKKPAPAADVKTANLVKLMSVAQAQLATHDGFHLWYWGIDGHFHPQIGNEPSGVALYANSKFAKKG